MGANKPEGIRMFGGAFKCIFKLGFFPLSGAFILVKSILIVDEDRNLGHSEALILRQAGYEVVTAISAHEALAYLRNCQFDLTILDLMTPDSGSILLPKLLGLYAKQAILVLTDQASRDTPLETTHLGAHSRLVKPVAPETLLERVRTILR
jgi:DNA-binding response OmpR family regulator